MAALRGDVFISKLRKFRLSFAVFQYSNPYFPNISHYPLQIFHTCEKIRRSADHRCICICIYYYYYYYYYYYHYYYYYYLFSYVSKVIRLLILAPLKKISWKESKFKTMKRRNVSDDGERGNKNCVSMLCASCLHLKNLHPHSPQRKFCDAGLNRSGCNKMKSVFQDRKIMLPFRIGLRSCQILDISVKCGR